ncbi:MAG: heme-binding domain-containing protein [Oligoflexia bacterium]|nr:heme-binding domain-containing protein [Oligoflexia bacterium]
MKINATYIAQVRSIFLAKCFDCHSNQNRFPWYHKVPGIKQWLDDDVAEGKEHINMSHDFPFQGHGSPQDDLEAIQESLTKKTMPPFFYRLMHRGSALTQDEQETVFQWAEQGLKMLKDIHP